MTTNEIDAVSLLSLMFLGALLIIPYLLLLLILINKLIKKGLFPLWLGWVLLIGSIVPLWLTAPVVSWRVAIFLLMVAPGMTRVFFFDKNFD